MSTSYTVQPGDTLTKIAIHAYGDQGSTGNQANVNLIMSANASVTDPDKIYVGEVLTIPPANATDDSGSTTAQPAADPTPAPQPNPTPAPAPASSTSSDALRNIIYFNSGTYPLETAANSKYTHVILSFLILDSELNVTLSGNLSSTVMGQIKTVQNAGKKVMISFGGATISHKDYASLVGKEQQVAQQIAAFVNQYDLDGVDIDYEDSSGLMFNNDYNGADFLVNLTEALYAALPEGKKVITHAPQPPYLIQAKTTMYADIINRAGDKIAWINMQYYNNKPYNDPPYLNTNYEQAVAGWAGYNGLPANKVVVGKPLSTSAAGSGYMAPADVVSQVVNPLMAKYPGQFGGVMGWQYLFDQDGEWGNTIGTALGL